ncbi:MAG: site-specific integrase, partial [Candidatus Omnitrophica bacterium]|nr:site-specific integrase [Candidatus Omnitrophota bacterium]
DKITNLQIEEYKAKIVKVGKIKNKTINNHLTALSKCLHCAKDWEVIDKVPKIIKLKPEPFKFDFLTVAESEQLLNNASGIWHDVFLVLLKTGMRKGELLALTWENINWERHQIVISQSMYARVISSTKSNRIRYVDMTREVYKCLHDRKKNRGFVFSDDEKKHFSMRRINDELTRLCKKAGLRKVNVHTLRHTFASHLAMAGAPIQAIQGLLGHADIQTTMRYAHLSPSVFRDTINLLEPETKKYNFGQHMGNKAHLASAFEKVLKANNVDNSANTKQKQLPKELPL